MSSNSEFSVQVEGLGKRYLVPHSLKSEGRMGKLVAHMREFLPFMGRDEQDFFWALRDLSFEVKPGEILGILGRNGSGKSTLLKILSGITQPTTGRAHLRGRVGSLLEVGTGFHPDLTGRENVFMSGVLLGLKRQEIAIKFDEIVDFSGIEAFIDMPVKRYSSGMYVRLAYSVASLLRADVLILDEVMAVGDASFREKSQRNIEKLANEGKTILFVSHNERAVRNLCHSGIILQNGACLFQGTADEAVTKYRQLLLHYTPTEHEVRRTSWDISDAPRHHSAGYRVMKWVSLHSSDGNKTRIFRTGEPMLVRIGFEGCTTEKVYFSVIIHNEFAEAVATVSSTHTGKPLSVGSDGVIECLIEDLRLGEGCYFLMVDFGFFGGNRLMTTSYDCVANAATFEVDLNGYLAGNGIDSFEGAVHRSQWGVSSSIAASS
jgi:lipopolysaccharide transport system ATP-binding protein